MLADKKFRDGVALVGRLGLSYDVSLYHPQINEVADLASALPDTRIVLNHVGGVLGLGAYRSKRDEVFSLWASSIKALAARPNVFVKLGGLGQSYTSLRFSRHPGLKFGPWEIRPAADLNEMMKESEQRRKNTVR
jgi:predicted TIM-barrel fold metal-dependent hydrolase